MQRTSRIPPEFLVEIPEELTAQYPSDKRDDSRLIVLDRVKSEICHVGRFSDIVGFLQDSLIVVNNTRVLPTRVYGTRPGGGKAELTFILDDIDRKGVIQALITPTQKLKSNLVLDLPGGATFTLERRAESRGWLGQWESRNYEDLQPWLAEHGVVPLPPYIRRSTESKDMERYQTVYAKQSGSMAAPTAGLHFTPELIASLRSNGNDFVEITLDVGLGTFVPISAEDLSQHKMQRETFHIPETAASKINAARNAGRMITAIGTTSTRALETATQDDGLVFAGGSASELFIYPPYEFRTVNQLVTNFHRPDSTLMQLVAAFAGWDLINQAYSTAVKERFRFYSYGDAMLIL